MNEYHLTYDGKRSVYRVWKSNEYGGRLNVYTNWSLASCMQYIDKMTKYSQNQDINE